MTDSVTGDSAFDSLLEYLEQSRGIDFTGYKRPSLMRRVAARLRETRVDSYDEYNDYLQVHPEEFEALLDSILINVTSFFRDPGAWRFLASDALPAIATAKRANEQIRAWSAGCASGEEPCTLAIRLAEELGLEEYSRRVKIYATDIDEKTLETARRAAYGPKAIQAVPEGLRAKYFDRVDGQFVLNQALRRNIVFGRHNIVRDAPISRLDLLCCRNTFMYLNAETQQRVLRLMHHALLEGGLLFLGSAEMPILEAGLFESRSLEHRIFGKLPGTPKPGAWAAHAGTRMSAATPGTLENGHLLLAAFDRALSADLLVDADGVLIRANSQSMSLFRLGAGDIGRPFQDLALSYRPVELRSLMDRAHRSMQPVTIPDVVIVGGNGETRHSEVLVAPLQGEGEEGPGTLIRFMDRTKEMNLSANLDRAAKNLQETNEALQSTNEELETTNEELQSTNEELETANEELQSANEELRRMNTELMSHAATLRLVDGSLEALLDGNGSSLVVVSRDLVVRLWKVRGRDLWGLHPSDVLGKPLSDLDWGFRGEDLGASIQDCLAGETNAPRTRVEANGRDGRPFSCQVECSPLPGLDGQKVPGVVLLVIPDGPFEA